MAGWLYDGWDTYRIIDWPDSSDDRRLTFAGSEDASRFLERFVFDDDRNIDTLRDYLAWNGVHDLYDLSDHDVVREMAWRLASGRPCLVAEPEFRPFFGAAPAVPKKPELAPEPEPEDERWKLALERYYHDDEPIHGAEFEVELANGQIVKGKLDSQGKANLQNLPDEPKRVRFEPDVRQYERIDKRDNPDYQEQFSSADARTIIDRYWGDR